MWYCLQNTTLPLFLIRCFPISFIGLYNRSYDFDRHNHPFLYRYRSSDRTDERIHPAIGFHSRADSRIIGCKGAVSGFGGTLMSCTDRFYDGGPGFGFCHYLDSCTAALLVGGFVADKSVGGCFLRMAEPLAGKRVGSNKIYASGQPYDLCNRVYRW